MMPRLKAPCCWTGQLCASVLIVLLLASSSVAASKEYAEGITSPTRVEALRLSQTPRRLLGSVSSLPGKSSGDYRYESCARVIAGNTAISPETRGPTTGKTFTYEKKYDDIDDCFEECRSHYIVHDTDSGKCYCWMEQGCKPKGFCAEGGCSGSSFGVWESEEGVIVYDQTACYYGRSCDDDASSDSSEAQLASCIREIGDTAISPQTRGPTPEKTFTYEKKFDGLEECFEECPSHYIVHDKDSGKCYCWMEQSCKPKGFCAEGGCSGSPSGVWESEEGVVVYDQTACYRSCDDDSSDSSEAPSPPKDDSSDSSEAPSPPKDDSSDSSEAPSPPKDESSDESCNLSWEPRECQRSDRDDPDKRYDMAPKGYGCTAANSEKVLKFGDTWMDRPTGDDFTYTYGEFKYCMHVVAARSFSRSVVTYDNEAKECRIGCKVEDMECLPGVQTGKSCDEIFS